MSIRRPIIEYLRLLSTPSEQLDYERSLTVAGHAPTELISIYCDNLYNPKSRDFVSSFTLDELKDLAHLFGLLAEASNSDYASVSDMLKDPKWRQVVTLAKNLRSHFDSAA